MANRRGLTDAQKCRVTQRNIELGLQGAADLEHWDCTIRRVRFEGRIYYVINFADE